MTYRWPKVAIIVWLALMFLLGVSIGTGFAGYQPHGSYVPIGVQHGVDHHKHRTHSHFDRHHGALKLVSQPVTAAVTAPAGPAQDTSHGKDVAMRGSPAPVARVDTKPDLGFVNSTVTPSVGQTKEMKMDWTAFILKGFTLIGIAWVFWTAGKYGWKAVSTGITSAFSIAKTDFLALEQRVKNLEDGSVIPVPGTPAATVTNTGAPTVATAPGAQKAPAAGSPSG